MIPTNLLIINNGLRTKLSILARHIPIYNFETKILIETSLLDSIHKKKIKNYRPICIFSMIPKIFENLISRQLHPIQSTII